MHGKRPVNPVFKAVYRHETIVGLGLVEDGPAERAGIQPIQMKIVRYGGALIRKLDPASADVVVAIDGKAVHNVDELLTEVESHAPGQVVTVTVLRGNRTVDVRESEPLALPPVARIAGDDHLGATCRRLETMVPSHDW
jgi:S1-C subfamily serine protease